MAKQRKGIIATIGKRFFGRYRSLEDDEPLKCLVVDCGDTWLFRCKNIGALRLGIIRLYN